MSVTDSIAALIARSLAQERAGDFAAALRTAQQALDAARTAQDDAAIAAAPVAVARYRFRLGQEGQACALAQEALALAGPESAARVGARSICDTKILVVMVLTTRRSAAAWRRPTPRRARARSG